MSKVGTVLAPLEVDRDVFIWLQRLEPECGTSPIIDAKLEYILRRNPVAASEVNFVLTNQISALVEHEMIMMAFDR